MQLRQTCRKITASFLLTVLISELLAPTAAYALTSGPSQPEMQSFEPVGTTDLVNPFSGDFIYNIPLLDVEGYPVNIAYHSGASVEDEASWVGLGWNINPGNISRAVRGIPDDFNGETIEKQVKINPELKKRFGMFFGLEVAGIGIDKAAANVAKLLNVSVGGNVSMGIALSNYTGVSATLGLGSNLGLRNDWMSAGVNMGATFSTDQGVDIDASVYGGVSSSKSSQGLTSAVNGSFGKGFNSREGLKYTSFGVNPSISFGQKSSASAFASKLASYLPTGVNNSMVPISMQNFVPVITNVAFMESQFFQLKVGIESGASVYPNFGGSYGEDRTSFQEDGSRKAYGYLNLENAEPEDITDFSRDRDGRFNRGMQYLPPGSMAYDIYAVNGQGTGGNFRAMRTDAGSVYDPYTTSENKAVNNLVEIGAGNIFEAGWDRVNSFTTSTSGPWTNKKKPFSARKPGSLHEPVFFKQAGEASEVSSDYYTAIGRTDALLNKDIDGVNPSPLEQNLPDARARVKRSNLLYSFKAAEARDSNVSYEPNLRNYSTNGDLTYSTIPRVGGNRRATQESEFTQLLPDGRRYIYGVPAMNNRQIEYVTSLPGTTPANANMISLDSTEVYSSAYQDPVFGQSFLMKTSTPSFAHSYLLSSILSPDYSDLTGDGLTEDDIGTYTKFNYNRKDSDYQWRTPYQSRMGQFNEGVASDCHDDKATFVIGSKEIWMLHSIETKNYIAFFHTSARKDARASNDTVLQISGAQGQSYKLDSIVLYNRQELAANKISQTHTVPVKTVIFTYDYSLCKGAPNAVDSTTGKLTLRAITIKSGASDIGYLSPYRFSYGANPGYGTDNKDMWGGYKPAEANGDLQLGNNKFPYVVQDSAQATYNAGVWNLTDIRLPSGGAIHVDYEADDYAFVQDRRAMEMFKLRGVGPDERFIAGTSLYQSQTSPYLYLYFQRKKRNGQYDELYPQMLKAYLENNKLLQYNVKVRISAQGERTESCANELADYIKGYAGVEALGICSNDPDYGFIKLSPKTVDKMPSLAKIPGSDISLNPITLSAIFYARYYNNKALYPGTEIVSLNNTSALLKQLISSFGDLSDYFRSPLAKYINQGKAKAVDLDESYLRLCSQGKKFGGGHRVRRIKFTDNWDAVSASGQPVANYGSEYSYQVDDGNGRMVSSGVASYEPLLGGDENPFKEPLITEQIGQKRDFPMVLPTELVTEGPIGETLYPSASVGYRKVTITSIHKSEGASSQTIQEKAFYTAKDFPVRVSHTQIEPLENRPPKALDFSLNKRETFRAAQGYSLIFNDMHGKPSRERVLVQSGDAKPTEVSYKNYEYFTNADGTLNNSVMCLTASNSADFVPAFKTIGVETDVMMDSREKIERTTTTGFMANLNIFMGPAVPIPIPTAFPKIPKSNTKTFSSVVCTKVVQQYGILKSVETFDKGAKVKLSNEVFDASTGQPIVTKVNTEHNDYEFQIKAPAYWAYRNMGAGYQNILYEEEIGSKAATIAGDTLYFESNGADRFQPGDELLLKVNEGCGFGTITDPVTYKLWVVAKPNYKPRSLSSPQCHCQRVPGQSISYSAHHPCTDGHSKTYVQYPQLRVGGSGGPTSDNVCGEPQTFVVRDTSTGWTTLNTLVHFGGSSSNSRMQQLYEMLYGAPRYPLESMTFEYDGGDYPTPNHPKGPSNLLGDYAPLAGDTIRIWWQDRKGPWEHGGYTKPNFVSYKGIVDDSNHYRLEYRDRPMIEKANKLLKVTVNVAATRVAYLTDGGIVNKKHFMTIGDFHGPQPVGHQWRCTYTLYFPFDKGALANITPAEISALNKPETYWYGEWETVNAKVWNPGYDPRITSSPERIPLFDRLAPDSIDGYRHVRDSTTWFYWSNAEVITRSSIEGRTANGNTIAAIPRKRNEVPRYGVSGPQFPNDGTITRGSIKVIRSGFRNQLNEEIDQRSTVGDTLFDGYHYPSANFFRRPAIGKLISASASTYTDGGVASESVAYDGTDYYNPYVTGMNGNPRILSKYNVRANRNYSANTDPGKGFLENVSAFWERVSAGDPNYAYINPVPYLPWVKDVTVKTYSPFGNDLEVEDAAGNLQSMLYGYGNSLPIASVKNSSWNNALYENFEDKGFPAPYVSIYQNELRKYVFMGGGNVSVIAAAHHTGNFALQVSGTVALQLKLQASVPTSYPPRALHPFYFRPGRKYVLSYWQAANQNTANLTAAGVVSVKINNIYQQVYPKSPVIDGWVLYEGEIEIPKLRPPFKSGQAILELAAGTIDDLRILPVESNMKCYVYNPVNRKLAASLDENHMASFFEYDAEGKLVRVKKETERGILTLKESRSSVHSISPANGSTTLTQ